MLLVIPLILIIWLLWRIKRQTKVKRTRPGTLAHARLQRQIQRGQARLVQEAALEALRKQCEITRQNPTEQNVRVMRTLKENAGLR